MDSLSAYNQSQTPPIYLITLRQSLSVPMMAYSHLKYKHNHQMKTSTHNVIETTSDGVNRTIISNVQPVDYITTQEYPLVIFSLWLEAN